MYNVLRITRPSSHIPKYIKSNDIIYRILKIKNNKVYYDATINKVYQASLCDPLSIFEYQLEKGYMKPLNYIPKFPREPQV